VPTTTAAAALLNQSNHGSDDQSLEENGVLHFFEVQGVASTVASDGGVTSLCVSAWCVY